MNYLNKTILIALTALPLLFASDSSGNPVHDDERQLPANVGFSTSCFDFLMADIRNWFFGDTIPDNLIIRYERIQLPENVRFSTDADIDQIEPISCFDFLTPDIRNWFFGDTIPDAFITLWASSTLEKLSLGQLMALVKKDEIGSGYLLWIPFMQFFQLLKKFYK